MRYPQVHGRDHAASEQLRTSGMCPAELPFASSWNRLAPESVAIFMASELDYKYGQKLAILTFT